MCHSPGIVAPKEGVVCNPPSEAYAFYSSVPLVIGLVTRRSDLFKRCGFWFPIIQQPVDWLIGNSQGPRWRVILQHRRIITRVQNHMIAFDCMVHFGEPEKQETFDEVKSRVYQGLKLAGELEEELF